MFGTACAQKYMAYALHTHKHKHTHRHATYTCMCVALTMPSFKRLLKGLLRSFLEKALKGAYFRRAASSTQETPWGAGVKKKNQNQHSRHLQLYQFANIPIYEHLSVKLVEGSLLIILLRSLLVQGPPPPHHFSLTHTTQT